MTTGIPTPPPPTAPTLTAGGNLSLNNVAYSGDLKVNGNITATGTACTIMAVIIRVATTIKTTHATSCGTITAYTTG